MIHATVRHRLTRDDAQLVARLIARDSGAPLEEIERRLADEGIDSVLDDPLLPTAMLRAGQGMWTSLPLFSYVMVRHALRRVGEEDRRLADYVAAVLMHFGMRDNAHRVSAADDQVYDSLAALLADVDDPDGRRSFLVGRHLLFGNLFLGKPRQHRLRRRLALYLSHHQRHEEQHKARYELLHRNLLLAALQVLML